MGRRKSDKSWFYLGVGLILSLCLLSSVLGYRAMCAMNKFEETMDDVRAASQARRYLPPTEM